MTTEEATEVSRIARQNLMTNGLRIKGLPKFPHVFHTIMTLLTCGLWLPVYALCYQFSDRRRFLAARNTAMLIQARHNIETRRMAHAYRDNGYSGNVPEYAHA